MAGLTLDTGALIGYERADTRTRAVLGRAYARGVVPTVPAGVLVEAWRGGARSARLASLRRTVNVLSLDEQLAAAAGELLARSRVGRHGAIDATVVAVASMRGEAILTSDPDDLGRMVAALKRGARPQLIAL